MKHMLRYYLNKLWLWYHRKQIKLWWTDLHCNICGRSVLKRKGDYFMLKDKIWQEVCNNDIISKDYVLCKKCVERILRRKLKPNDYKNI